MPPTTTAAPVRYRIDARRFEDSKIVTFGHGWHGNGALMVRAEIPARYGWRDEASTAVRDKAMAIVREASQKVRSNSPQAELGDLIVNGRFDGKPKPLWPGHFLQPIVGTSYYADRDLLELAERLTRRKAVSPDAIWRKVNHLAGLDIVLVLTDVDGTIGAIAATHRGPGR